MLDNWLEHTTSQINKSVINTYPFEHVIVDNFLPISNAQEFYQGVMRIKTEQQTQIYDHPDNGTKYQFGQETGNPHLKFLLGVFGSAGLSTVIAKHFDFEQELHPDPTFDGGGVTFSPPGTFLRYHCDFNYSSNTEQYRVINAILYLNYNYESHLGGHLHLIDPQSDTVEVTVEPVFNRCVIFKTSENSPHGVSRNNQDFTRVSFNSYFYADQPLLSTQTSPHKTLWKNL